MAAAAKLLGPRIDPLVEWRARRIPDPIRRLRYLRQEMQGELPPPIGVKLQKRDSRRWVLCAALGASLLAPAYTPSKARAPLNVPAPASRVLPTTVDADPQVWPVESTPHFDLYSNGLRIENEFAVPGKTRLPYPVYAPTKSGSGATRERAMEWRSKYAGIVFHSTESHQAPFEASEVRSLKRLGRSLLAYVRAQQSYHFVIDRFGRVFRVVAETGIANHAGRSVWSDEKGAYVNLNASFLSVAFESQTDASVPLSTAQIHAAKVLTRMLRYKYGIAAANCITHAQVSVNSSNMRIGYHTDWASGFPFAELDLPDNYAQVVPSMFLFGFDYDDAFSAAAGKPWAGLTATERLLSEQALAAGLTPSMYRRRLRERYRRIVSNAELHSNEEIPK